MRRCRASWLLFFVAGLFATASLAASFAHRTDLGDWSLGRFSPPLEEPPPAEAGSPRPPDADADAAEPAPWPKRYALRIDRTDVRGPWPLSALLQEALDELPQRTGLSTVLGIDRWPSDGTFRSFAGIAQPSVQAGRGAFFNLGSLPIVLGAVGSPTECQASGLPGAERCLGLEALEGGGLTALFVESPPRRDGRLTLGGRLLVVMGYDPVDQRAFHRVRVEAWLPERELANLPRRARDAAGMAMLAAPDRDTDGDGAGDAYTFHIEAWGEPIELQGRPAWAQIGWRRSAAAFAP